MTGFAPFWVYQNTTRKRASLHVAACGHCNNGSGTHNTEVRTSDQWHPARTFDEAMTILEGFGYGSRALPCLHCNPRPESSPEIKPIDDAAGNASGLVISHADASPFKSAGLRSFFEYRQLGIAGPTGGAFGAQIIRAVPGDASSQEWHMHSLDFQLVYVIKGWVEFEYEGHGKVILRAGASALQPPRIVHREVRHSDDMELLEVTAPAEFATSPAEAPL